jgi:AcrR family transcriptional regulator
MNGVNIYGVVMKARSADPGPYHHGDLHRALIAAALALVTEEQNWTFSLREVARRAGVSQSAPYNHFADKRDLLAAVAVAGFHRLRDGLISAVAGLSAAPEAFLICVRTYVRLGIENPALYRLMFGPELTETKALRRPPEVTAAGLAAKAILERIILDGAQSGDFAISLADDGELAVATFTAWSAAHGVTMLIIDNLMEEQIPMQSAIETVIYVQFDALKRGMSTIVCHEHANSEGGVEPSEK